MSKNKTTMSYGGSCFRSAIGRFASADTLVPDFANPQSFNRFSYVLNNPISFSDPSGHAPSDGCDYEGCNLPDFMDPDNTWIDDEGTYYTVDPKLIEEYPGASPTEVGVFFVGGMTVVAIGPTVIEYVAAQVIVPTIAQIGSTISSWLCLDSDCTNELQALTDRTMKIRETLNKIWEKNVAASNYTINGISGTADAVSGEQPWSDILSNPNLVSNAPTSRILLAEAGRGFDTEVLILEDIAQSYSYDPLMEGTIRIFTELAPCSSCAEAIKQFEQLFPNVSITVDHGY
ncbi:MAG: deaminase domain-containing protein [Candidatus Promineifilaceae bacterium]